MISQSRFNNKVFVTRFQIKKILGLGLLLILPSPVFAGPLWGACSVLCGFECAATGPFYPVCVAACLAGCSATCFSNTTTITVLRDGVEVEQNIAEVHAGDQVRTFIDGKLAWTKVFRNIKTQGNFEFVQIIAENQATGNHKQLCVTPTHGMVLLNANDTLVLDIADHVAIGDKIIAADGTALSVVAISKGFMHERYTLETIEGTVIASGIFVSIICAEELEGGKKPFELTMQDWHKRHLFGDIVQ